MEKSDIWSDFKPQYCRKRKQTNKQKNQSDIWQELCDTQDNLI
jgi:hypothetical protein